MSPFIKNGPPAGKLLFPFLCIKWKNQAYTNMKRESTFSWRSKPGFLLFYEEAGKMEKHKLETLPMAGAWVWALRLLAALGLLLPLLEWALPP